MYIKHFFLFNHAIENKWYLLKNKKKYGLVYIFKKYIYIKVYFRVQLSRVVPIFFSRKTLINRILTCHLCRYI